MSATRATCSYPTHFHHCHSPPAHAVTQASIFLPTATSLYLSVPSYAVGGAAGDSSSSGDSIASGPSVGIAVAAIVVLVLIIIAIISESARRVIHLLLTSLGTCSSALAPPRLQLCSLCRACLRRLAVLRTLRQCVLLRPWRVQGAPSRDRQPPASGHRPQSAHCWRRYGRSPCLEWHSCGS